MVYNNLDKLRWLNESKADFDGNKIVMQATKDSNLFCCYDEKRENVWSCFTAPYLYVEKDTDFVATVKLKADFKNTFDSAVLLIVKDETIWAKACYEKTDYDTIAVVSVVNNIVSDDANGCNIFQEYVWLKAARKGNDIGFYYSLDGKNYYMMRTCNMPLGKTIKIGIAAQCPMGEGTNCYFENFTVEDKTVENMRKGE